MTRYWKCSGTATVQIRALGLTTVMTAERLRMPWDAHVFVTDLGCNTARPFYNAPRFEFLNSLNNMENIDSLKRNLSGTPRYKLRNGNLFVSPGGIHFLDYLDPVEQIDPEIAASEIKEADMRYIEYSLQFNDERFESQVDTVARQMTITAARFLDIGCGGGLFLSKIKTAGGETTGIELNDVRAHYAKTIHGLNVLKIPIESDYWTVEHANYFDAVSLWDVIEHVNFPVKTVESAMSVLRPGGRIFIDTPCRDSFYHRFGEFTYKVSFGMFPTFLNTMYSAHLFGHKQILSTCEMETLLAEAGFVDVSVEKFHELSFPYSYYLKKLLKFDILVKLALPATHLFLMIFPIKNKMLASATRPRIDEQQSNGDKVSGNPID